MKKQEKDWSLEECIEASAQDAARFHRTVRAGRGEGKVGVEGRKQGAATCRASHEIESQAAHLSGRGNVPRYFSRTSRRPSVKSSAMLAAMLWPPLCSQGQQKGKDGKGRGKQKGKSTKGKGEGAKDDQDPAQNRGNFQG